MNIQTVLQQAITALKASSDTAQLDAEILLAHSLNVSRSYLYTWPEKPLDEQSLKYFKRLLTKRLQGIPIAYILGKREFWSLELLVDDHSLIPRPETELLISLALEKFGSTPIKALDLGTGTGAIALALAKERPRWQIIATDISPEALNVAKQNRQRLKLEQIELRISDWFENIPERDFQLICANPPYLSEQDPHLDQGDVRFEPRSALCSAEQGLADLALITTQAWDYLAPKGWLLLEHGADQGQAVAQLLGKRPYQAIAC